MFTRTHGASRLCPPYKYRYIRAHDHRRPRKKAIAKLPPADLARFRAWFDEFDAARFDQKIERDAKAGKLDRLADQAIDDLRKGRAREL